MDGAESALVVATKRARCSRLFIRRSMLELLRGDGLRVTGLAVPFDISLAGASKHMRVLEDAG